jgi:predicted enzyme related to lactoylglutathione lyase
MLAIESTATSTRRVMTRTTTRRLKYHRCRGGFSRVFHLAWVEEALMRSLLLALSFVLLAAPALVAAPAAAAQTPAVGVAPQYSTSHVYVAPGDLAAFTASFVATFGGKTAPPGVLTITPTPSKTDWQAVSTPAGLISAFGFTTPVPFPFGLERTGYLVTDMDAAVTAAREDGASIVVAPFPDPIGRDVILQWPGGVFMQLYWHTVAPNSPPLATIPENRVYVSPDSADDFIRDFVDFSHGTIVSQVTKAPGIEVGEPGGTYRRVRIESAFGKITVLVTDGHLPFPYGRETTGYEVANLADTLAKAKAAGVTVIVPPFLSDGRTAAFVQFPGGYIAEIHATAR